MDSENHVTILLVEDESLIAMQEKMILEKRGYTVHHALSGEKAVQIVLSSTLPVDLVLMDIDLGSGIDGTQAAEEILKYREIPIIFLSSHIETEMVEKTEKITSYGYVVKNSGSVVLEASIKMAVKLFLSRTEQQKAENALKKSDHEMRLTLEATTDGIWYWDFKSGKMYFSPKYYTMLGYSPNEFPATFENWKALIHPDDLAGAISVADTFLACKPDNYENEFRMKTRSGDYRWIQATARIVEKDSNGEPVRLIGNHRDITERKSVEHKNKLLSSIIERSQDFIGLATPDQCASFVNAAGKEMLGIESDEIVKKTKIEDYFFPEDIPFVYGTIIPQLMREGRWAGEFRFKHFVTGEPIYVYYDLFLTEDPLAGETTNISTISRDITAQKKVERELIRSKELAEVNERIVRTQNEEYKAINEELRQANDNFLVVKKKFEESEERFNWAMDASQDGIFDWNLESNAIYYSPGWKRMLGYEEHELPNDFSVWEKATDPEDMKKSWELQQKLISKQVDRFVMEFKMKKKDGKQVDILSRAKAIFNEDGKAVRIVGTHTDITERKQAETAMRNIQDKFRSFMDNNPSAAWITDRSGVITYASSRYAKMFPLGDPTGRNVFDAYPEPVAREYVANNERVLIEGIELETVESGLRADGTKGFFFVHKFPVRSEDGSLQVGGTALDITEHNQAEEALRLSEEKYRLAMESTFDGIWDWDVVNNTVFYSSAWRKILSYDFIEPRYESWESKIHPDDKQAVLDSLKAHMNGFTNAWQVEHRLKASDGAWKWVLGRGRVVSRDDKGIPLRLVGTMTDITERKQAEEEMKRQLSEKAILLKEVHHRVKNNIFSIEGLLRMQADSTSSPEVKKALMDAMARVQSIRVLYEKLLLGKEYHDVSIREYAEGLIDSIVQVFTQNQSIAIEKNIADFSIASKTAVTIGIVINELLTNVFKYAFKGRESGTVSISISIENEEATIIIQDNGIGFDERILERDSPGFGLTIVKMLIEQLKGNFENIIENGTRSVMRFNI